MQRPIHFIALPPWECKLQIVQVTVSVDNVSKTAPPCSVSFYQHEVMHGPGCLAVSAELIYFMSAGFSPTTALLSKILLIIVSLTETAP